MKFKSNFIEKKLRVNRQIRVLKVRLIDNNGNQLGVVTTEKALELAKDVNLDLVEISPQANPPVCKILDYGKYKFDQKKRLKESQKKQKKFQVKEIKLRPKIDQHDYEFKLKHIQNFLSKGDKVKVVLQFRGREMVHRNLGENIMHKLLEILSDKVVIEKKAALEGRQIVMILAPKSNIKEIRN